MVWSAIGKSVWKDATELTGANIQRNLLDQNYQMTGGSATRGQNMIFLALKNAASPSLGWR